MDYGQTDASFNDSYAPDAQAPNVNAFIELLNSAHFSPFMGISSAARNEMFEALRSPRFQHYNSKGGMVARPDGFITNKLDGPILPSIRFPETIEDEIILTPAQHELYLSDCAAGFTGGIYKWVVTNRGTISIGVTSEAPAVSFDPVTHSHDSATNKDETVHDITKMAVTQENVNEMYTLAKETGYTGSIDNFIHALNSGTPIELVVPAHYCDMQGPVVEPGQTARPMPNRSAGETEVHPERQAQIDKLIEVAANPETLQKFVTEKMIPTFTKALAELADKYTGKDLLRQQRRISDRLQKLLVYVSAPERIVGTCIHDVHEMQIYKHYIATHVVAGTMTEAAGSQAITVAMEKLEERNAAMDVARAKDIKDKADAKFISACRGGLRRLAGDDMAWSDVATTVTYLRTIATRLESTYKETPVETDMGMSYDTIVGAPEHVGFDPKRTDIQVSLDPRDTNPEATISAIQELCKGQAKNRYYLNGTQVGNDPYGHMGTAIEKQQRLDASIGETLKESPAMSAMQVHIDTMLKALGLTDLNMSGDNRNKLISHMLPSMASTMTLARSIPPARNNSMSLQDLFDSLHPAGACTKS